MLNIFLIIIDDEDNAKGGQKTIMVPGGMMPGQQLMGNDANDITKMWKPK